MQTDKLSTARFSLVTLWFGVAYLTLVISLFTLIFSSQTKQILSQEQNFRLYAALPDNSIQTVDSIVKEDARARIVANFFQGYTSPLASFADEFITVADEYHLDYRLLPSIAMQESNGAKRIIADSYNPFGFGIYGDKVIRFTSYGEAIERVGRSLRADYLDQGLTNPEEIMTKYTPPSLAKGGTWAKGVLSFMSELK